MKGLSAAKSSAVNLFCIDNYVIATDGSIVSVYSSDLNFKLLSQFSVFDYAKNPTAIGVVNLSITAPATKIDNAPEKIEKLTPFKKAKMHMSSSNPGTPKKVMTTRRPLLCVGTATGSLVFVCFLTQEKDSQVASYKLENEQSNGKTLSPVTCMQSNEKQLHIGFEDGQVLSAGLEVASDTNKISYTALKCSERKISAIATSVCNTYLATAVGSEVTVWDVASKIILKSLKPFQVDITSLCFVPDLNSNGNPPQTEETPKKKKFKRNLTSSLLAASDACKYATVWNWSKNASKNFNLTSNFCQLSYFGTMKPCVVSRLIAMTVHDGSLEIVSANVEGKTGKPTYRIRVVESETNVSVPVFTSCFTSDSIVIFYGLFPEFVSVEKIEVKSLSSNVDHVVKTVDPRNRVAVTQVSVSNVAQPITSKARKSMITSLSSHVPVAKDEPSLIELLNNMASSSSSNFSSKISSTTDSSSSLQPKVKKITAGSYAMKREGNSRALLLMQCLSSNDSTKLSDILTQNNEALVRETVSNLNGPQIYTLVTHIFKSIEKLGSNAVYLWLQEILLIHFEYLQSCKSFKPQFDRMRQMVANESSTVDKLKTLKSKLEVTLLQKLRADNERPGVGSSVYADEEEPEFESEPEVCKSLSTTTPKSLKRRQSQISKGEQSFSLNELKPDKSLLDIADVRSSSKKGATNDAGSDGDNSLSDSDESMSE
ncbi:WD repeat-containing protein 43-like [Convolutriloba macropyga]|uniref:WD repeat-containing protein 43-like n=1 Tax=Convolutriloba macropyga TaxID=536237 RepID=UPI003F51B5D4